MFVNKKQTYPDHPDRFDKYPQVLCRESLTGHCYWETEYKGKTDISVTYKGISRKGWSNDCWFGCNEKSWSLTCFYDSFTAKHNNGSTDIKHRAPSHLSNRVGVYVDWSAGRVSFYSVSDTHTLTHLHTFNTTFTEPLYAGFEVYSDSRALIVYSDSSVSLCKITPLPVKKTSWHSWDSHYLCL